MLKYPEELASRSYNLRKSGMSYGEIVRELSEEKTRNGKKITRTHVYRWIRSHARDN